MMMMLTLFWILAVPAINAQASVYHNRVIHVHNNGNDNESCLIGLEMRQRKPDRHQYCKTMGFVADKLRNSGSRNVTIILETPISVKKAITFYNHEYLIIQGKGDSTYLNCNCNKPNSIGISFICITNLKLKGFNIMKCCGVMNNYSASVLIKNCSNITIENSQIYNNDYSNGLILLNPSGEVNIRKSKFSGNIPRSSNDISIIGAGLHIEFTQYRSTHAIVTVVISHCDFFDNVLRGQKGNHDDPLPLDVVKKRKWKRQNNGGGMAIALLNGAHSTNISIFDSNFVNNRAWWGGGLCIYVQKGAYKNTVFVSNATFTKNFASWGGGGIQVTLGQLDKKSQNHIYIEGVTFEMNCATFGGGTSVNALLLSYAPKPGEILAFVNCTWYRNAAHYSPAVDLSLYKFDLLRQGYSPSPLFKDIKIQSNYNISKYVDGKNHVIQGAFAITRFTAYFQGNIQFKDNRYTALYLISGRAVFANCSVLFYRNLGIRGGAIAIRSFSALVVNGYSHFTFINNNATRVGGGVYYAPIDQRECFSGQTCFLEYGGKENNVSRRNISFIFSGNKAPLGGTSIYSESIYSCYYAYFEDIGAKISNLTRFFDLIGNFHFDAELHNFNSTATPLTTAPRKMIFNHVSPLKTPPGKSLYFPIVMHDEFNTTIYTEVGLRVAEDSKQVSLDNHFTTNNKTHILGPPDQNVTLMQHR